METSPQGEHSTVPYYAQVDVFDPTVTSAIPMWTDEFIHRGIAAGPSGMAIATRSDFERGSDDLASVRMRVWIGDTGAVSGSAIYEGALQIGGEGIVIGSVVGNDLHRVAVPAGDYRVRVHVEPSTSPDLIDVVLRREPSMDS
jgi:hypothetical protein